MYSMLFQFNQFDIDEIRKISLKLFDNSVRYIVQCTAIDNSCYQEHRFRDVTTRRLKACKNNVLTSTQPSDISFIHSVISTNNIIPTLICFLLSLFQKKVLDIANTLF